ncbi:flagellar protein FliT [Noviherbaspirillum pedocola]|uniref:Flagellar protein FliT n=1 Tax=Noviherbaspirillum pedocola TaxID=2801341 RepID=A0A934SN49_9BURK|nr:flagellar protein FliT [Noviherbaspirillum pedocola]MBK4733515.1 flagellar protein FliT [Noviherbaspirillum pedocola]
MSGDSSGLCAIYQQLAELSLDMLRVCRERDWESFAALNAGEAALLARLQAFDAAQRAQWAAPERIEALILQTLSNQREAQRLLAPWREEIAVQLRSAGSSRKLANAYGGQGPR